MTMGRQANGDDAEGPKHSVMIVDDEAATRKLLRATVEGLCFELARRIGWLVESGCPVERLIMCGGGARSRVTPQIVADVVARPVMLPAQPEISAFGAAVLARAMLEGDTPIEELYRQMAGPTAQVRPGPAATEYAPMLREYVASLAGG